MHFQGQQLISQATHVSSRTLVTVSLAKISSVWFGVNTSDLEVLGLQLGDAFVALIPYFIVFLALNHLLSWLGDLNSFQGWNSGEKVAPESVWDAGSGRALPTKFQSAIDGFRSVDSAVEQVKQLLERYADTQHDDSRKMDLQKLKQLVEQAKTVTDKQTKDLQDLLKRTKNLTLHAKVYLWGWFFLMPFGIAGYALYLSIVAVETFPPVNPHTDTRQFLEIHDQHL